MQRLMPLAIVALAMPWMASSVIADETVTTEESISKELSVPLLDHVTYPKNRADWVTDDADVDGSTDDPKTLHRLVVVSAPYDTPEQAAEERELLARAAVITYATGLMGLHVEEFDPIKDGSWDQWVSRSYAGEVTQGDMPRYEAAWELTFDDDDRAKLTEAAKNTEVRKRLAILGVLAGGGFVMLLGSGGVLNLLSRRQG